MSNQPDWGTFLEGRLPGHPRLAVVEVGSTAHGTALDGADDFDISVVWLESLRQVFSTRQVKPRKMVRTRPEGTRSGPGDIDANVYTFRAWLNLAVKGNPSILQMIWCPILEDRNGFWASFRSMGHAFIGAHLIGPYMGYMNSQIGRINGERGGGHGRRGSGGREELIEAHGFDTKFAMHAARLGFQCLELFETGELQLPMAGEAGDWLRGVRRGDVSFDDWLLRVVTLEQQCIAEASRLPRSARGPNLELLEGFSTMLHVIGAEGLAADRAVERAQAEMDRFPIRGLREIP